MKKGRLLVLFALILCLSVLFAACNGGPAGTETTTETTTDVTTGATTSTQGETEPEQIKHNMHDYLVYKDKDISVYNAIQQLEGEFIEADGAHNLIVVRERDIDARNNLIEKYKVYDLVSGEVIFERENTSQYYNNAIPDGETRTTLSVTLDYPIIRETRTHERGGDTLGSSTTYEISYYAAKKDGELIYKTTDAAYTDYNIDALENLYAFKLGDKIFWIDNNMDIIRTVDVIAANGYDTNGFEAEYKGYLYAWTNKALQVFNHAGLCSVSYSVEDEENANISCHVLNDGNVFVQKQTIVDIYTACDYVYMGNRVVLTSYIVNAVTGEMTETETEFIVSSLMSAYTEEGRLKNSSARIFTLAEGRQNKAVIIRVANGMMAKTTEYVVLDNQMNVEYTVLNSNPDASFGINLNAVNYNLYSVNVAANGTSSMQIFDLDGNYVCTNASGMGITDRYIVTENAIYDHNMNKVYDIYKNSFRFSQILDEKIFLTKTNFVTGANETYVFDVNKKEPVLFADGINTTYMPLRLNIGGSPSGAIENCYILYNTETKIFTLYAADGTELLSSNNNIWAVSHNDDILVVRTLFEGKYSDKNIYYVVR